MAVPSAVLRQRKALEAELGINADGTPVAATPAPALDTTDPTETSSAAPDPVPQVSTPSPALDSPDAATARIRELEHLLSTRDGQTSTAMREANEARQRAEVMASQVSSLEENMVALQRQVETAEARAASRAADGAIPSLDSIEDLTPEEIKLFGADSVSFVDKLTKKQLASYVKPMLLKLEAMEKQLARVSELDQLPQLQKAVASTATETERVREEEFFRKEVLHYFPDFESIRDTPDWKAYLVADVPGRGIKNHHLLDQYRKVHNAQGIRSMIQAHYDAAQMKPSLASLSTPRGAKTEGTPVVKPKMKASEYKTKLRQFTSRQLAKPAWDDFKTVFNAALAEGRVEMDERL